MHSGWQRLVGSVVLTVALTRVGFVSAHHSFAMYDSDKVVTVEGTIKEFEWANPHVVIRVEAASPSGVGDGPLWTIELPAPSQESRNGWTHSTLTPGEKITVDLHPFKDGRLGGSFVSAMLPDGHKITR